MNVATYAAFKDELEKLSWHAGAEIAGLGILAAPTIQKMRGKPMSERGTHAAEIAGLGTLAVPAAHSIYKAVKKGGLAAIKHASVGQVAGSFGAGTSHFLDTARRAVGPSLAQRTAARAAKMKMIAHKANPVKTLPSSGKVITAAISKEAFLGFGKAVAKQAFKPSFAGHAKALGTGISKSKAGVETVKSFNPMTQSLSKSKSISIPGLTR